MQTNHSQPDKTNRKKAEEIKIVAKGLKDKRC